MGIDKGMGGKRVGIYRRSRVGGGRGIDRGVGWEGIEWG